MKIKTLRALKTEDLKTKLKELRDLKIKLETERRHKKVLEKPSELRNVRKNIARILTILNERKKMTKE
jgi:large subunit ribosomal protein L29